MSILLVVQLHLAEILKQRRRQFDIAGLQKQLQPTRRVEDLVLIGAVKLLPSKLDRESNL
ncbi:MAG TPA: hypothetical protein EYQ31_04890 [Candidatus Handelsmanbacteria bacterium]|nr:hypothetical protein [Candidatus Handelsmanbacteria bacterium]